MVDMVWENTQKLPLLPKIALDIKPSSILASGCQPKTFYIILSVSTRQGDPVHYADLAR